MAPGRSSKIRHCSAPTARLSKNSLQSISVSGRVDFPIEFIVEKVYAPIRTDGKSVCKFLLANGKVKIVGLSNSKVGEQIRDILKEGQYYMIRAGGVTATTKNRKFRSASTKSFDIWINDLDKIELLGDTNSDINVCLTTIRDLDRKMSEDRRRKITFSISGARLTSGYVRRYLGCPTCTRSIREPNSLGLYLCTNSPSKCSSSGNPITRKLCFLVTDISITQNKDKITGIICFDKEAEIIIGRDASAFAHDLEATEEFRRMMNKVLKLEMHAERDELKEWNITLHNITIEETENSDSEWATDGNISELNELPAKGHILIRAKRCYAPYLLTSQPCGLVLIILNLNYENPKQNRSGSETDAENIKTLLQLIGYEVTIKKDVKKKELHGVIEAFQHECKELAVDSCMVFVLSHGNNFEIEMVDGQNLNVWTSVVYPFTELLHGKPKLFFFDICQDFIKSPADNNFVDPTIVPQCTDMLVTFSTLPGHASHRNTTSGSQFANHLVKILNKHGKSADIRILMDMVQYDMHHKTKKPQICVSIPILFRTLFLPKQQ